MGIGKHCILLLGVLSGITTGCDFRGGGSGQERQGQLPREPQTGLLTILTQWPQDDETRVPLDASLALHFDAPLHPDCIDDGLTYLEESSSFARVPVDFAFTADDQTLVIRPGTLLREKTWYTCHLSPLLCDRDERLLEEDLYFSFQTKDLTPPVGGSPSVPDQATGVARSLAISVGFDEPIDPTSLTPATVMLTGPGGPQPLRTRLSGNTLWIETARDLLGQTRYELSIPAGSDGVRDLAGNLLATEVRTSFTTAIDTSPPKLERIDPRGPIVSPSAHIVLQFDEAVVPASVNATSIAFRHENGSAVAFDTVPEPDHRLIRLVPRAPMDIHARYSVNVRTGTGSVTDPNGNLLANSLFAVLQIGTDLTPPALVSSQPANEATRVSHNVRPSFDFSEALDASRVNEDVISFGDESGPLSFVATLENGDRRVTVTPTAALRPGHHYTIRFAGGPMGLRDTAANTMAADQSVGFSTNTDQSLPNVVLSPIHGHSAMPPTGSFTAAFDEALDPASVGPATVLVTDNRNQVVPGNLSLTHGNRIIRFVPDQPYRGGEWYAVTLRAGDEGVREQSGNWLATPVTRSFKVSPTADVTPPEVRIALNGTSATRTVGLSVPRNGFEITASAEDPINYDIDLSSYEVTIQGPGAVPSPAEILAGATITKEGISFLITAEREFAPGEYEIQARATDLAGNVGTAEPLRFRVVDFDGQSMPFERTQVVWVRFDLDRDGSGRGDFEEDLERLGLTAPGDPAGTNARMFELMRDGVLAQAHTVFERKANGGRTDRQSIPLLFTPVRPSGVPYSEIALGGLDPSQPKGRRFGEPSSGVLGRAYFDKFNSSRTDKNVANDPGLGVFTGELYLFEVESHLMLYPIFLTSFAKRFMKLIPEMGGTPAGAHSLDTRLLHRDYRVDDAPPTEQRRYLDIFLAADDWATAAGIILAHEVGHTVGLVPTGAPPAGLHGDNSLHNHMAELGNVMSSAVGYDTLVTLPHRFRDLNLAYLRQQMLLK